MIFRQYKKLQSLEPTLIICFYQDFFYLLHFFKLSKMCFIEYLLSLQLLIEEINILDKSLLINVVSVLFTFCDI